MSMIYADDVPMSERPLLERVRHLLDMVDRGVISEKHMADLMGKIEPVKTWNEHAWEEQIEDTYEAMIEPKLALAKSVERVRELEYKLRRAEKMIADRDKAIAEDCQALNAMTEDRDEYRAMCQEYPLHEYLMADATDDERAVVLAFIAKVMGEGRKEYGPLNLSTDKRTAEQLRAEQRDEWLDSEFYGIVAGMKEGM